MKYRGILTPELGKVASVRFKVGIRPKDKHARQTPLVSTVRFAYGKVERVPNLQFNPGFATEKFIFLAKMRMR